MVAPSEHTHISSTSSPGPGPGYQPPHDLGPLVTHARVLSEALIAEGYSTAGLADFLDSRIPGAYSAVMAGNPGAAIAACDGESALDILVRSLLLHVPDPRLRGWMDGNCGPHVYEDLLHGGLIIEPSQGAWSWDGANSSSDLGPVPSYCAFDARPLAEGPLVFSDVDASFVAHVPGSDHVLGIGAASLSLAQAVPDSSVSSILDVGTGGGIQLLVQAVRHAASADGKPPRLVGTDIHPRALDFARATLAAAGLDEDVDLRQGSWLEPVAAGERFERIIANPPFVVGLPEVGHVYRDSGMNLDQATEMLVRTVPEFLESGGIAVLMGAWVGDAARVSAWVPEGCSAWVIERDHVSAAEYVATWTADEGVDPRSPEAIERTRRWLKHFKDHDVASIGFGYIAVRRNGPDQQDYVVAERISQPHTDPIGVEVEGFFALNDWALSVSEEEVLASRFAVSPAAALDVVSQVAPDAQGGFEHTVTRFSRLDGVLFSHDIDPALATIIAGLRPDGLCLGEVIDLYVLSTALQSGEQPALVDDEQQFRRFVAGSIVELVRHGLVIPESLVADTPDDCR